VAGAMLEKFGGDALREIKANVEHYLQQINARWAPPVPGA